MNWQRLSSWLGAAAACIGGLGAIGWIFRIPVLTRLHPDWVTMKINTALCLLLSGISVMILAAGQQTGTRRLLVSCFCLAIFTVGLATLLEHLWNVDLGLDQALVTESVESAGNSFPGRMGPTSAIVFMCLGAAIHLLDRKPRVAQGLIFGAMFLTYGIFLCTFFDVEIPSALSRYFSIALHTVLAFLLLLTGLLLARPREGVMAVFLAPDAGGGMARRLLPAALVIPALSGWLFVLGREKGFYGTGVPTALLAGWVTLIFTWLVWAAASAVQRVELQRRTALQENEERMRLAAATSGFGFHDYDVRLDRAVWSSELYKITGVEPGDPITLQRVDRLTHPEDQERVQALMKASFDPGGTGEFCEEFRIRREDSGETRWVLNRCRTIFLGSGTSRRAVRNMGVVSDITARKEAELRLRESEDRYRAFIRNSSEGIWRLEFNPPIDTGLPTEEQVEQAYLQGRFAECNEVMARMYGMNGAEDMIGQALGVMLPATDPEAKAFLASIIDAGYRADDVESAERTITGEVVHFSNSMVGVVEDGFLKRIWGTQREITERKRAQDALAGSEKRFRGIFANAAMGMALVDLQGHWVQVNDLVCAITGYSREELLGHNFAEITHPEDLDVDVSNTVKLREGEISTYSMEKRYRRKSGELIWVNLTVSLQADQAGAPQYFISVIEDITERKRIAEALRESIEEAQRSRLQAESASRAKDDFLAALSHELRTPLSPVLMTADDLAMDERLPEDVRTQLGMICRNVTLEARLIDDLLDLTRIIKGKMAVNPTIVDAHALLHLTAQMVQADVAERQLDLSFELHAASHWIPADGARMQQVFWNLLKNAVKFTPDGGRIRIESGNGPDGTIILKVVDTGRGIPSEDLTRIFHPFEQAGTTGNHSFGGLGLGLSISKALVEMHQGTLTASSDGPGKGAEFTLALATCAPPVQQPALPADTSGPVTNGIRLLFVEDHAPTLETTVRLLRRRGYEVSPASTVRSALDLCAGQTFDLVITDIGLPDGTGISLMEQIQSRYRLPGIALSGYGMEHDLQATAAAGFALHLVKPVSFADLTKAIEVLTPTP